MIVNTNPGHLAEDDLYMVHRALRLLRHHAIQDCMPIIRGFRIANGKGQQALIFFEPGPEPRRQQVLGTANDAGNAFVTFLGDKAVTVTPAKPDREHVFASVLGVEHHQLEGEFARFFVQVSDPSLSVVVRTDSPGFRELLQESQELLCDRIVKLIVEQRVPLPR